MASPNFTRDGEKQQTFEQLACSTGINSGIHGQLIFLSVLNIFISITAFFENVLILAALRKESLLHPPSKLLLRSLAITDLCVGLISEPLYVTFLMSVVNGHCAVCRYVLAARIIVNYSLCIVPLLTLTALSVDRLLALLLGLRYRQVVTLKRTYVIVITFWAVSTLFSMMYFWNPFITLRYATLVIPLCLVTSIISYTKIFVKLRRHQNQTQDLQQPNQVNPLNIARYRKAVSSALWLQMTLVACYLPYVIVIVLVLNNGLLSSVFLAWCYAGTLVLLNSTLNPILYCWKIDEVRQAVKDTIRQVLCCLSS